MSMRPQKPFTRNDEVLGRTTYVSCDGFKIHVEGIWGIEYVSPTGRVIYKGHHGLKLLLRVIDAAIYPGLVYDEAVAEYNKWCDARPKAFRRAGNGSGMWRTREGDKLVDSPSFFTLDRKLAIRVIMELGRDKTAKRCFAVGDSVYTAPNDHSSKIVIVEGDIVVIRRHGRSRRFHVNDVYTPQEFGKITRLLPR